MFEGDSGSVQRDEQWQLPSFLALSTFSAARSKEIQIMRKATSTSTAVKLAFQKLPKHMRRRAMSHNVKRLPRRLREIHLSQMKKSGIPPKQKRPSRKYRRRPYNLNSDHIRRQRRVAWLNTHIWHAKRFHMIEKWNYRLPYSPCDKSFRACYRATTRHCLLQDISYYSCVELKGDFDVLIKGMDTITVPTMGLSFKAKSCISGNREGTVTLFQQKKKVVIGIVYFIWRPDVVGATGMRTLWIWLHAAIYQAALDTLLECFNLKLTKSTADSNYCYSNDGGLELTELKYELSRFRLTGSLANAVFQNAFKIPTGGEIANNKWLKNYFQSECIHYAMKYWNNLKGVSSTSAISPHVVIPVLVKDPRFYLPKKRTKSLPTDLDEYPVLLEPLEEKYLDSPLWNENIRKFVTGSKISQARLAELRSNLLVPGSDFEEESTIVPIILIQRPGRSDNGTGYGTGWDIILPSAWAQPFWISLIMWGCRAGGLRETDSVNFESDRQYVLYPDTASGQKEEQSLLEKSRNAFFKLPPNKRTNYNKFGISSPFTFNWNMLINEWSDGAAVQDFIVLRDKKLLRLLQQTMSAPNRKQSDVPVIANNYLIPVSIKMEGKGLCRKFSIICLPQEGDHKTKPLEPKRKDPNESLRKEMRKEHRILLKRLRRARVRATRSGKVVPIDCSILEAYTKTMRKLWLPETKTIRRSCSREVMGFVKYGDFSFSVGNSKAIGYVTTGALNKLLRQKRPNKVLVRNTNSRQYLLGSMVIICE